MIIQLSIEAKMDNECGSFNNMDSRMVAKLRKNQIRPEVLL